MGKNYVANILDDKFRLSFLRRRHEWITNCGFVKYDVTNLELSTGRRKLEALIVSMSDQMFAVGKRQRPLTFHRVLKSSHI